MGPRIAAVFWFTYLFAARKGPQKRVGGRGGGKGGGAVNTSKPTGSTSHSFGPWHPAI